MSPAATPNATAADRLPRDVRACLLPGERVILAFRPGVASVVLRRWRAFLVLVIVSAALVYLALEQWIVLSPLAAFMLGVVAMCMLVFWGHLDLSMRSYVLTDRRAVSSSGVFRRLTVDSPLVVIQQAVIYRSLRERLFGLGTIGLSTPADAGAPSVVWSMVERPDELVAQVRLHVARAAAAGQQSTMSNSRSVPRRAGNTIPVIGLAGGIGSGKSTVAGIFARLGCLVVDSDALARAALDRPDVRAEIVRWWGEGVLGPADGSGTRKVDRAKVAQIVFADAAERKRLEDLVHPLVRQDRAQAAREGAAAGARAVIVDAPLLFEAGLDAECDAVVFVDAARAARLRRVRESRNWDEAELDRRESAQLPLQSKRSRADYCVSNDGALPELERDVARVLAEIEQRAASGPLPPPTGRR
ncbi:MAG: dephospho-CoA kinase [Phycisphaeraceae bacterium]|nr:dephospho-CoA kinase [Phycisphaeraceae bacterium]